MEEKRTGGVENGRIFRRRYPEEGTCRRGKNQQKGYAYEKESKVYDDIQNLKRMEDIEKVRMTQQPYLTSTNTHFRGSTS